MRDMRLKVTYSNKTFPTSKVIKTIAADIYVDEFFTDAESIADMPVSEIAYIKVFNNPIRGSGARAIAIYTKKGNETEPSSVVKYRLPLIGIQQLN